MSDAAATANATIQIKGTSLLTADLLQAEAMPVESLIRNAFFLLTGMCFPIISMIVFSCLEGGIMWGLGLVTAVGPFVACFMGLVWKKPWGVVVETPTRYRTVCQTATKDEAEQIVGQIRAAIA
jgi:hypothetical protein